jgi:biopolymer transport protein ExbD
MPVQLSGSYSGDDHGDEARVEVVPLIDIMFFLLAAFMLVSLSMVKLRSVTVDLPTATVVTAETTEDLVSLSVDKAGLIYFEQSPVGPNELVVKLAGLMLTNADLRVFISGDREARHGDIIRALDVVRGVGIDRVAFEIGPDPSLATPSQP